MTHSGSINPRLASQGHNWHVSVTILHKSLILRFQLESISHVAKELVVNTDKVQLRIEGSENFYTFSYSTDGVKFITIGKADTNLISTETAGGFTGIYLGLFTSGNGTK